MISVNNCGLLIVDIQGKLARLVHDSEAIIQSTRKLIECCQLLSVPIVILEQNPQGLGHTVEELAEHLTEIEPIEKHHFDGIREDVVQQVLSHSGKQYWLVVGIEAHICVYQTVNGLKSNGYTPIVVSDCISSRTLANRALAIANMRQSGIEVTSLEMCLYQLMGSSQHPAFKHILNVVK